jgi:hypothetical protein
MEYPHLVYKDYEVHKEAENIIHSKKQIQLKPTLNWQRDWD